MFGTCTFLNYNAIDQSTAETSGVYIREGNRLLFPAPNLLFTTYLLLSTDESELYWCDYYFSSAYLNQSSEEVEYSGFEQYPCFILDETEPLVDYRQNYFQLQTNDTLGVVLVNQVLLLQE